MTAIVTMDPKFTYLINFLLKWVRNLISAKRNVAVQWIRLDLKYLVFPYYYARGKNIFTNHWIYYTFTTDWDPRTANQCKVAKFSQRKWNNTLLFAVSIFRIWKYEISKFWGWFWKKWFVLKKLIILQDLVKFSAVRGNLENKIQVYIYK